MIAVVAAARFRAGHPSVRSATMLILSDLAAWQSDPLDSPAGGPAVKPIMSGADAAAVTTLRALADQTSGPSPRQVTTTGAGDRWRALLVVEQADRSQYDALLAMARQRAGIPAPIAAIALTGHGFHGNRGRPWLAARGNLHLSCALPVDLDLAKTAAGIPAVAAVAVCDALVRCAPGLEPRLKWVNDVLLDGAKTAGVLASAQIRGTRALTVVLGIGVNLAVAPAVTPTLFVPRVTCLHQHPPATGVTLPDLTWALLEALWTRLQELQDTGAASVVDAYRRAWGDQGRKVAVWAEGLPDVTRAADLPPPLARGRALALTDDLALVIQGASGPLSGGRLAHLDDEPSLKLFP
jgi:BirA family transcriptional regulator, biotin operon repressor / biotin---[acetyl-CoA-carboxylase] ligase